MFRQSCSLPGWRKASLRKAPKCRSLSLCKSSHRERQFVGRTREFIQWVKGFAELYVQEHGRAPNVTETLKGAPIDHDTLWKCMDYEAYIAELGGKLATNVRHRFVMPTSSLRPPSRWSRRPATSCPSPRSSRSWACPTPHIWRTSSTSAPRKFTKRRGCRCPVKVRSLSDLTRIPPNVLHSVTQSPVWLGTRRGRLLDPLPCLHPSKSSA